jgi:hypothetical protein
MKIIYITTSLEKNDFEAIYQDGSSLPNPAGQNFHRRLINSLATENELEIISSVPVGIKTIFKDKNHYHYVYGGNNKIDAFLSKPKKIIDIGTKIFKEEKPIILFDPLNMTVAKAATKLAKLRNLKSVCILTDNPKNLANPNYLYSKRVLYYAHQANGSISLVEPLVAAYGLLDKPHCEIQGIASDEIQKVKPCIGTYIYFGGALFERYGAGDLLKAYIKAKPNYDLYVAGHGPLSLLFEEASKKNGRIKFMGQITPIQNVSLELGATLLINPRRNDQKLDMESVPSKLFEYLASKSAILSTPNPYLQSEFPNDINWLPNSGERALEDFLLEHLDVDGNFIKLLPNKSYEKAIQQYGYSATAKKIQPLIASLNSDSN